jgi:pimeloyl-ACP methyl ester carboxylesterase
MVKRAMPMDPRTLPSTSSSTTYHRADVDGVGIFYREAGQKDAPAVVLLHGFPSSSRMFDHLIPLLAVRYHVIAPDYPGFGQSDSPAPGKFEYTFDRLAEIVGLLLKQLGLHRWHLFMQDYGGPVGFRLMERSPASLCSIIIQNANAYRDGLGPKWEGIASYWANPDSHPEVYEAFASLEGARQRHIAGSPTPERYNPDTWIDEFAALSRAGIGEIQSRLLLDYRTNVDAYPRWQAWLRNHKPPALVVWGRYDPSFIVPGALAYRSDLPDAEIHLLDAGHFALDEKLDEIARLMIEFLDRHSC